MTSENDIIDLTSSFTLNDHCTMANIVIELDDSLTNSPVPKKITKSLKISAPKKTVLPSETIKNNTRTKPTGFGDCPICWDELGKNPLASTKCGHVYCLKCLQLYLSQVKKCPSCRCPLKGAYAYHPIYLSRQ